MVKVVLDTTYILPILGVKVKLRGYEELFPKLISTVEAYYSPLSLVEAKWIILRLARRLGSEEAGMVLREYRLGLDTILYDHRLKQTILTNSEVEEIADKLLHHGVRDYFDRMIYAIACYYQAVLLTEDEDLHKLYAEVDERLKPASVMRWDDIVERIRTGKR